MRLLKVQKSISFIPFDYPDPLISQIIRYNHRNYEYQGVSLIGNFNRKIDILHRLGYKVPVLENNEKRSKSLRTHNRKLQKPQRVHLPSPGDFNELIPHLNSLNQILNRINPERKSSGQGDLRINYKSIRRGLTR